MNAGIGVVAAPGLELAQHLTAAHLHGADLGDVAVAWTAAGGLEVHHDEGTSASGAWRSSKLACTAVRWAGWVRSGRPAWPGHQGRGLDTGHCPRPTPVARGRGYVSTHPTSVKDTGPTKGARHARRVQSPSGAGPGVRGMPRHRAVRRGPLKLDAGERAGVGAFSCRPVSCRAARPRRWWRAGTRSRSVVERSASRSALAWGG